MNSHPYWYRLLDIFERKGYFGNGLTLPFIIGAREYIEPAENLQTIIEFINEINNSSYYISILKCDGIGEYVFSISNKSDMKIYGGVGNIVIVDSSFNIGVSSADIINDLEIKYKGLINSKLYSKIDGGWGGYSDKEKGRLQELNAIQ